MTSSVSTALGDIDRLRARGEATGYAALASELGEMNARLGTVLHQVEREQAVALMHAFYPLVFEGMVELSRTDPALRAKIAKTVDVTYALHVEETGFTFTLKIERGAFSYSFEAPSHAHVTMTTTPEVLLDIMTGRTDAIVAFMSGDVDAEGELTRARGLRSVFEALENRFGFHIMQF